MSKHDSRYYYNGHDFPILKEGSKVRINPSHWSSPSERREWEGHMGRLPMNGIFEVSFDNGSCLHIKEVKGVDMTLYDTKKSDNSKHSYGFYRYRYIPVIVEALPDELFTL